MNLLLDQKSAEERLVELNRFDAKRADRLEKFLELAGTAWLSYRSAFPEEKREMVEMATSNRQVSSKQLEFEPSLAFKPFINRFQNIDCDPHRDIPRTWDQILKNLTTLNGQGLLPDLSVTHGFSNPGVVNPDADREDDCMEEME